MSFFGDNPLDNLFGDLVVPHGANQNAPPAPPAKPPAAKPPKRNRDRRGSITPLTCADINQLPGSATDFTMNRHSASLVSLVGAVRDSETECFVLDDRTGWILCSTASRRSDTRGAELRLRNGDYALVIGEIERELSPTDLGGFGTGGFIINAAHIERLESINAISNHMLQTVRAKLLYITEDNRLAAQFHGSPTRML